MLTVSKNRTVLGIFDDIETLKEKFFRESDLTVEEVEELCDECRLEITPTCILHIEEYKENTLDGFFSKEDICIDDNEEEIIGEDFYSDIYDNF